MASRAGAAFPFVAMLLLLAPGVEPIGLWLPPPYGGGRLGAAPGRYLTQEERWMNQTLDHFNPTDHRQFKQRYYEFLDYYRAPKGPIFLYICGESSCNGIPNSYLAVMAKKFGAAVVSPEHRYYGKSSPFESLTTENLRFLSSKQALFDLAVFRQYYQETLNAKYNRSGADSSWFVFGGSYAGALSAWFRLKFPHLTCGSLASSGVVLSVYNFTAFDKQIGESAGPECKAALQETTKLVDGQLQSGRNSVKQLFGASMLENDGDFLFLLADAAAIAFQYGNPDAVCSPLIEAKKNGTDLVETFARYVKDYYIGTFGASVASYDQEYLKNTTPTPAESAYRLWWYQVCSEVAYFQVAPKNDSVRSAKIDTRYHLDLCTNVFGEGVYPDVFMTNLYYGGTRIAGSKIVFANGSQDPWRHASKQKSSKELPSYLIECSNCGHCSDLSGCPQAPSHIEGYSSNCSSPEAVNKIRKQIADHIDLWLYQNAKTKDHRQFKQRYYEFPDHHAAGGDGPVFLRICGEESCNGIPNDYLAVLAKKFGAAVVTPEHRYYGKSSPFESLTTENLRFLSSKQALFDLAAFRQHYQETLNARHNRSSGFDNPWFVFGVSYAGALSAWFRLKFPHLTCGSLASSGVVLSVYNFTDFDKQVGESAGPECKAALQEITRLVDEQLRLDSHSVKALFGAETLKNDGDFLFFLADAAAIAFQYGNPDAVCPPLINAKKSGRSLVETYAQYVKDFYIGRWGTAVSSYDQEYLKKMTLDDTSYRLWWFQVCSEVAYFQVAPQNDSVRSPKIDTRYHLDLCRKVFGEGVYPDVFMTNLYYGGTRIAASKIVFTNGSQDPWRHASKQKSSEDMPSYIMKCRNCGHGTDLRGCPQLPSRIEGDPSNCSSPEAVSTVRKQIASHIDLWLSQCQGPARAW
ncbi:hypothetical protein E2562_010667 [Oryza meyeriana var. granulata]|uniref:Serine carboxypeptidase S28 family protein n=1 Tax=Oryza meyeriana var. granulata TaxID=110450 RepID=A0A6G1EVV8_9ORYZ|nr:hypothetical protein E2562_010667 [Oryza meyeriana var. granulata]KAF0928793.1 hypothetical protein E2562_010667 [Oryza meyeriana var. granulata]